MSETTEITFKTPGERVTSSSSSGIVDRKTSKAMFAPPKDEEATFGTSVENRRPSSDVHANIHELDVKKKQVSQRFVPMR